MRVLIEVDKKQSAYCSIDSDISFVYDNNGQDIIEVGRSCIISPPMFFQNSDVERTSKQINTFFSESERKKKEDALVAKFGDEDLNNIHVLTFSCGVQFFDIDKEPKGKEEYCDSLKDMHIKILQHECPNKKIYSKDNPRDKMVSFACECGLYWSTRIKEDPEKDYIGIYMLSSKSRKSLADLLSKGWFPEEWAEDIDLTQKTHEKGEGWEPDRFGICEHVGMVAWKGPFSCLKSVIGVEIK